MTDASDISRRQLMQTLAATTTMATFAGCAAVAEPSSELARPAMAMPTNPDVVVIGAGSAGLAAARQLMSDGLEVVVIEAADRIGGRAWTESDTLGAPFDRGGSWLQGPRAAPHVARARELGFTLQDHSNARDVLFIGDRRADATERRQRDRAWSSFYAALSGSQSDIAADQVVALDEPFAKTVATWMGPMDFGVDINNLSRADWYSFADYDHNYLVREGLGALVASLGEGLPVQLGTAVRGVDWSGQGVRVETTAGTIEARACIVTVSTGVLGSGAIRFTPALPAAKKDAIADLPMGQLLKVGLMFDGARFGLSPNDFVSHDIDGPLPAEACYYLAFPAGHDYMVGFMGGSFGRAMEREGEAAAIDFALERLVACIGSDVRRHFLRGTMAGWNENPLTLGAYSAVRPGGFAARRTLAEPLGGRVFFAGEAMATPYATLVLGAHMHGARVARDVAAAVHGAN